MNTNDSASSLVGIVSLSAVSAVTGTAVTAVAPTATTLFAPEPAFTYSAPVKPLFIHNRGFNPFIKKVLPTKPVVFNRKFNIICGSSLR